VEFDPDDAVCSSLTSAIIAASLRAKRFSIEDAAVEGAVLRLRPIMMTMLVATLGLLPAALSHAIGSDSQRPFAIAIVGGLIAALIMSIFLLPTLYVRVAVDVLPRAEEEFEIGEHVD
jgi:heavy metal efflux system protein